MKYLKSTLIAISLATASTFSNAYVQVVFDPTAVANMVKQLAQMQQQYEVMRKQYESTTGNTGIGTTKDVKDVVSGWCC